MMVAPANTCMPLSSLPSGFTTISSVSRTSSTTKPIWPSLACSTTIFTVRLDRSAVLVRPGAEAESLAQIDQGQQLTPKSKHRRAIHHFDAVTGFLALEPHELQQIGLRYRVALAGAHHDQRGHDREGQGNANLQGRSLTRAAVKSTLPPIRSILVLTTSMPTPRPETFVTLAAVENPGKKHQLHELVFAHAAPADPR